ncbi:methyltransferase family protein [Tepidiforma sp.]|uniref:methyltransferase family protein n=1 Tax=Tepidiforma sp. TaxID=2682230 RepID=UPI002ADE5780|nr:methyltransferase [Tepidiforma sp.]
MTSSPVSTWRRRISMAQDAALVVISALFFYAHGKSALEGHSLASAFFAVEQALLIGIFLTRRRPIYTSPHIYDWVIATIGGWLALASRPAPTGGILETYGIDLQVVGLTWVIVSFATLGRSFGVVAANRGLKTAGPYRVVRHPIYLGHNITLAGFFLANLWWWNGLILATVLVFQVLRILAEERVLSATSDYADYARRVRWRLVPGVF